MNVHSQAVARTVDEAQALAACSDDVARGPVHLAGGHAWAHRGLRRLHRPLDEGRDVQELGVGRAEPAASGHVGRIAVEAAAGVDLHGHVAPEAVRPRVVMREGAVGAEGHVGELRLCALRLMACTEDGPDPRPAGSRSPGALP